MNDNAEQKRSFCDLSLISLSFVICPILLLLLSSFSIVSNTSTHNTALAICNVLNKSTCPQPLGQSNKTPATNNYQFVRHWGSPGSGEGQFHSPHGIAIDPLGNVYVADTGNNRIQKFGNNGTFMKWGPSVPTVQFHAPEGIALATLGNVYVADTGGNGVSEFTGNGTRIEGRVTYIEPKAIATDISDTVYVAGNNQIVTKPINGLFNNAWGNYSGFKFENGVGIAIDSSGDNVFVADTGNNRIEKFTINGTLVTTWGKPGKGDGQFISPLAIAVDSSGDNVFVADTGNNRIQKFDSNGTFITKIGSAGSTNGHFLFPSGVAVDSSGNLYVVDRGNNRIQVFAPSTR